MIMRLILFALLVSVSACGEPPTPTATADPQSRAWYACTTFIQQQLGVSSNDAQRYTSSGVTTSGDQYTVEVFYANLGSTYRCELSRHANGDWELLSLDVK